MFEVVGVGLGIGGGLENALLGVGGGEGLVRGLENAVVGCMWCVCGGGEGVENAVMGGGRG